MNIAVYCRSLSGLGGGVKHGFLPIKPLLGLHDVTVFHSTQGGISPSKIAQAYGCDVAGVRFVPLDHEASLTRITKTYELFINITYASVVPSCAKRSLLLVFFPLPLDDYSDGKRTTPQLPHYCKRFRTTLLQAVDAVDPSLQNRSFNQIRSEHGLARTVLRVPLFAARKLAWSLPFDIRLGYTAILSYDKVLANSHYTARWVSKYYGREATINYPPVEMAIGSTGKKECLVLSVGRFEPGEMSKKHDVLLAAFKDLYDEGTLSGWRMIICGGSEGTPAFRACIDDIKKKAEGYPVTIEVDVEFERLLAHYRTASLYWHAMGYGEDPERHPWRFEHFGMTTAEAMLAGCIPMVIGAGGQPEIVDDRINGFIWCSLEELKEQVKEFKTLYPEKIQQMRVSARRKAAQFALNNFYTRTCEIYDSLGIPSVHPLENGIRGLQTSWCRSPMEDSNG